MKPSIIHGSNVWFKSTLPFKVKENQIIYVEDEYNPKINQFIEKNYDTIKTLLQDEEYDFAYIPVIQRNLIDENTSVIPVNRSKITSESIARLKNIPPQKIYNTIFSYLNEEKSLKPGLILYQKTENNVYIFSYFEMNIITDYEFWNEIKWYIENIQNPILSKTFNMRHVVPPAMHDRTIVDNFEGSLQDKYSDIGEFILQTFSIAEQQKLSELRVTEDYRILLTDYDNMEIHLTPLQKAVYLFFLKHPKGVVFDVAFKDKYKDELLRIYIKLSTRDNDAKEKSIDALVDPSENSFYEKCSFIRIAFIKGLKDFDKSLIENYCITANERHFAHKKIPLDEKLVRIEADI